MGDYPKTFVTQHLSATIIKEAVLALSPFLRAELESNVLLKASYGYGSGLHPELCYRDMEVGIGWLDRFMSDSLKQGIVVPGRSDFTITIPINRMVIHFCHEGDIHTGGEDIALQKRLWSTMPFSDCSFSCFEGKYQT